MMKIWSPNIAGQRIHNTKGINHAPAKCVPAKEVNLNRQMQDAWKKHVWGTREVILSIVNSLPGTTSSVNSLLQNPAEMAGHFAPYYSTAVISEMADLFTTHLKQGGDIVTAAKTGDMKKVEDLTRQWYANSDDIARFYAGINPYYSEAEVRDMMYQHLKLTLTEASQEIRGQHDDAIKTFVQIQDEATQMADYFAAGLVKQFPDRF